MLGGLDETTGETDTRFVTPEPDVPLSPDAYAKLRILVLRNAARGVTAAKRDRFHYEAGRERATTVREAVERWLSERAA